MKARDRYFRFDFGLQTTQPRQGSKAFWYPIFQNVRTTSGGARRRLGRVLLDTISTEDYSGVYGGAERALAPVHTDQWDIGSQWTIEALVSPDSMLAGNEYPVFGFDQAADFPVRVYYDCGSNGVATLKATLYDLGGSSATVALSGTHADGDIVALQVVRDLNTITLRANGNEEASGTLAYTGTPAPTNGFALGGDDTLFFPGKIDFIRGQRIVKSDQRSGYMRLLNPRAPSVFMDYRGYPENGWVEDRSRYENHAKDSSAITTASPIGPLPVAVQSIDLMRGADKSKKLLVVADGRRYEGSM